MGNLALGPFLAAAALLVLAGLPKLADPASLVLALRSVGLPARPALGRALAAAEIGRRGLALAAPGRLSGALVVVAYLAFTAFVVVALSRGGVLASCGCFGRPDTPPTRSHLVVTAVLAAAGAAVAWAPPASLWSALGDQPASDSDARRLRRCSSPPSPTSRSPSYRP